MLEDIVFDFPFSCFYRIQNFWKSWSCFNKSENWIENAKQMSYKNILKL